MALLLWVSRCLMFWGMGDLLQARWPVYEPRSLPYYATGSEAACLDVRWRKHGGKVFSRPSILPRFPSARIYAQDAHKWLDVRSYSATCRSRAAVIHQWGEARRSLPPHEQVSAGWIDGCERCPSRQHETVYSSVLLYIDHVSLR